MFENKRKVRRATEAAGIPHTYVSASNFAAYFVGTLLHPREEKDHVTVYGTGDAKGKFSSLATCNIYPCPFMLLLTLDRVYIKTHAQAHTHI